MEIVYSDHSKTHIFDIVYQDGKYLINRTSFDSILLETINIDTLEEGIIYITNKIND